MPLWDAVYLVVSVLFWRTSFLACPFPQPKSTPTMFDTLVGATIGRPFARITAVMGGRAMRAPTGRCVAVPLWDAVCWVVGDCFCVLDCPSP